MLPLTAWSQNNLVLNPSFEIKSEPCPQGGIKEEIALHWSSPDAGDSDYFQECRTYLFGVPQNVCGYEYAKSGKTYAGFHPFRSNIFDGGGEFVQGKLSTLLQKDSVYCISFFISHADSVHYYINARHIGVWFINYKSGYPPTVTLNDSLPFIQQKIAFIPDTFYMENDSGWTELKTTYKAKGGETHFIIGNFTPKNQVQTTYKENGVSLNWYSTIAYYYLDEVSIYRCNDTLPPPVPKDTAYLNLPTAFSPNGDGQNDV
ncbi:MAG: hypothetical protein KJZ56_12085, partial [Flavobacteriales bacterium]|nr:hypothetical protein [Flavobacteriales bacterium]